MRGCSREQSIKNIPDSTTHGMTNTPEWETWRRIRARCYNENHHNYSHYGERGIIVCDRWLESFENFYEDMGDRPEGMSIERKDNDGDYTPDNCEWSTTETQNRNKSNNVWLELNGERKLQADWVRDTGLTLAAITSRRRKGWDDEKVLTTPLRVIKRRK